MKALRTFCLLIIGVAIICGTLYLCSGKRMDMEAVRKHYAGDSLKLAAAEFLWKNMGDKFAFNGELVERYDTLFSVYDDCLTKNGYTSPDPKPARQCWDSLVKFYGPIKTAFLEKKYDRQVLSADELIEEIDAAFEAWQSAPKFISRNFDLFCKYVLPYRVGTEKWEPLRRKEFEEFRKMRDSLVVNDDRLIKEFYHEFVKVRKYKNSHLMWGYPVSLSRSQIERARRGSCRHLCEYYVMALRACGIPATIDFVSTWGNRAGGHCWVTVLGDSGSLAFDALERKELVLAYKPAKVYRQTFEILPVEKEVERYVPDYLLNTNRLDVSHLYGKAFNLKVKGIKKVMKQYEDYPYGVICVFDNKRWIPIDYGKVSNGMFCFKNMIGDICYMAGYYVKGSFVPATDPFILTADAKIKHIRVSKIDTVTMFLERKYPKFTRIRSFQKGLVGAKVEGSDTEDFSRAETLLTIRNLEQEQDVFDTIIAGRKTYRYVRIKFDDEKGGNLAEIQFYGKQKDSEVETLLTGKVFGVPEKKSDTDWQKALDGDYSTYFKKNKKEVGYVGIDLGENNPYVVSRIRFVPQSDTNFIIPGNSYRLEYWDGFVWKWAGEQKASSFYLNFSGVPADGLYILHNLTAGKEERIFTYEGGKQLWW